MAQGILQKKLAGAGLSGCSVTSMGIHGLDNSAASKNAVEVCDEQNIDISSHRSRQLVAEELVNADLIFTMELVHKEFLRLFFPRVEEKCVLLGSWPNKETRRGNIKDPIGGSKREYRKAFENIDGHIERVFPLILEKIGGSGN